MLTTLLILLLAVVVWGALVQGSCRHPLAAPRVGRQFLPLHQILSCFWSLRLLQQQVQQQLRCRVLLQGCSISTTGCATSYTLFPCSQLLLLLLRLLHVIIRLLLLFLLPRVLLLPILNLLVSTLVSLPLLAHHSCLYLLVPYLLQLFPAVLLLLLVLASLLLLPTLQALQAVALLLLLLDNVIGADSHLLWRPFSRP
jgi:hypothetical protein